VLKEHDRELGASPRILDTLNPASCWGKERPVAKKNCSDEFRRQAIDLYESTPGATLRGIADRGLPGHTVGLVKVFGLGSRTAVHGEATRGRRY
jgi:hypothetical protein